MLRASNKKTVREITHPTCAAIGRVRAGTHHCSMTRERGIVLEAPDGTDCPVSRSLRGRAHRTRQLHVSGPESGQAVFNTP
jgi:hypothetical protein